MDLSLIRRLIASPAIRIFKKDTSDFVLHFLYQSYKLENKYYIGYADLHTAFRIYLEEMEEDRAFELVRDPEVYLKDWVDNGFLQKKIRLVNEHEEIVLEVSPELAKVFVWMEDLSNLEKRIVVGTESKFFSVLHKLKQLAEETETDPKLKIAQLEMKKQELEEQIARIRETGEVESLPEDRIRSQILYAKKEAMELVADFKQVEANFAEIRSNIQKKYLATSRKGEILEYVLDEDLELMNSDQGRSFQTFWEFLRSERNQDEWNAILSKLYGMDVIRRVDDDGFFRKLRRILRDAGGQVNSIVSGMSEQLKRSLVERTLRDNRRSKELIHEMKSIFLQDRDLADWSDDGWVWEDWDPIYLVMERPLWKGDTQSEAISITAESVEEVQEWEDLLRAFRSLDTKHLEENIASLLRYKPEVSLAEVLQKFPHPANLEAMVAYLWIASHQEQHSIVESEMFRFSGEGFTYEIPQAIYRVGN